MNWELFPLSERIALFEKRYAAIKRQIEESNATVHQLGEEARYAPGGYTGPGVPYTVAEHYADPTTTAALNARAIALLAAGDDAGPES